ncbi:MAG: type II toxin-antitoxin system VapC family toxin [Isosphaeraceae bacterium]|jgi:predicted nucleic acid-binding protein
MKYVIDASTAFQWEVPEPDSLKAIQLREDYRNGIHELISPDIFPAEVGNALIVAERKGRIIAGQFAVRLTAILAVCPDLHDTRPLILRACYIIASVTTGFRLSFYDALYVALAEREGCDLISGDGKLVRNLQTSYPFIKSLASLP